MARIEDGDYHRFNGDYEKAITEYTALLEEDAELYLARYGRALCYCFIGEFDDSIAELEAVRDAHPDFIKGRIDLFKTYLMLGMTDEAKGEARAILSADPHNEEVHKQLVFFDPADVAEITGG